MTATHCCQQLADALGNHDVRPTPAYISPERWAGPWQRVGWYPGATGPGYYLIHDLDDADCSNPTETIHAPTPPGSWDQPKIEYRPMTKCPYCGAYFRRPR